MNRSPWIRLAEKHLDVSVQVIDAGYSKIKD